MPVRPCVYFIMRITVMIVCASNFIADNIVGADHREEWVVRIQGGPQVASLLATQSGYKHHGQRANTAAVDATVTRILSSK